MKKNKIIIISYFYPPCNFVGAERTSYWAENLYKYGIYPIVITRNWNDGQKDILGKVHDNLNKIDRNSKREIHYLKHKTQLRDFVKKITVLRKFLTLLNQLIFYLFPLSINYSNFYRKAVKTIENDNDLKFLIISGRPFESFYFGYKLKKKFPHLSWIPDYRDQWNTYNDKKSKGSINKIFGPLEKKLERKWNTNCSFFITTSPIWRKNISDFLKKDGILIKNGYDEIKENKNLIENNESINITYAGTLYPNQEIEGFCKLISKLNSDFQNAFILNFIGCEMIKDQVLRLKSIKNKHVGEFNILKRMNKSDLEKKMQKADFFYLTSFDNVDGWYPVKLFEYASFKKPIILYPSDNSLIDDFISKTNTGYVINELDFLKKTLINSLNLKKNQGGLKLKINLKELQKFSREYQTEKLAKKLNQ